MSSDLFVIVGLGNPGGEYARTRHNAGFLLVDHLASRWHGSWAFEKKFNARLARVTTQDSRQALLCEPQTYMNSSGEAVRAVLDFYRVPANRLIVAVDDADLPLGQIRLRPGGSSGGHHGLESIEQHLATQNYARQRLGIGRQPGARQIAGYVLGRFDSTETALFDKVLDVAAEQIQCWVDAGIQKAMSQFNGSIEDPDKEREAQ